MATKATSVVTWSFCSVKLVRWRTLPARGERWLRWKCLREVAISVRSQTMWSANADDTQSTIMPWRSIRRHRGKRIVQCRSLVHEIEQITTANEGPELRRLIINLRVTLLFVVAGIAQCHSVYKDTP